MAEGDTGAALPRGRRGPIIWAPGTPASPHHAGLRGQRLQNPSGHGAPVAGPQGHHRRDRRAASVRGSTLLCGPDGSPSWGGRRRSEARQAPWARASGASAPGWAGRGPEAGAVLGGPAGQEEPAAAAGEEEGPGRSGRAAAAALRPRPAASAAAAVQQGRARAPSA